MNVMVAVAFVPELAASVAVMEAAGIGVPAVPAAGAATASVGDAFALVSAKLAVVVPNALATTL